MIIIDTLNTTSKQLAEYARQAIEAGAENIIGSSAYRRWEKEDVNLQLESYRKVVEMLNSVDIPAILNSGANISFDDKMKNKLGCLNKGETVEYYRGYLARDAFMSEGLYELKRFAFALYNQKRITLFQHRVKEGDYIYYAKGL